MTGFDHAGKNASSEWLTSVLKANGYLLSGEVIEVNQRATRNPATHTSEFYHLKMKYSPSSSGNPPSECLMKLGKPDFFRVSQNEARFYELARTSPPTESLLTSFGTAIDEAAQSAVTLLELRRNVYVATNGPIPPSLDLCEQAVRTLAAIHARWWNHLEPIERGFRRVADSIAKRLNLIAPFCDAFAGALSSSRRAIIEQLSDRYLQVLERRTDSTSTQTIIHGDAHFGNLLYPKNESWRPVLIDWQTCGVHFGAHDLAYMIGLHWDPARRTRDEKTLLRTYHSELRDRGVEYTYEDLWFDYRLQVAALVFVPIFQWSARIPGAPVWDHLDRAFAAFDDLDCRELLQ